MLEGADTITDDVGRREVALVVWMEECSSGMFVSSLNQRQVIAKV